MKPYHHFMHTTSLVLAAGAFKLGSALLGRALHHRKYINNAEMEHRRASAYGHLAPLTPEEEDFIEYHESVHSTLLHNSQRVTWLEADPCSDYDPIHPDYIDNLEK